MYRVKVDYKSFVFRTITDAMTFVGIVLNSAEEYYDVSIAKVVEDCEVPSNEK